MPTVDAGAGNEMDAQSEVDSGSTVWHSLFNGENFAGWDRYLGKPSANEPPLGLDNDPRGVYSVVMLDGEPALRISGEIWGSLISKDEFHRFHFRAQYKWGTRIWPPLNAFDSGIMYVSTGPLGAVNAGGNALSNPIGSGAFMVSMEYQLSPGDIGGIYNLGPIEHRSSSRSARQDRSSAWNQVDIIVQGDSAQHFLNGAKVAGASEFRLAWPAKTIEPLNHGKLQLQSEGGEIYFRHLELGILP